MDKILRENLPSYKVIIDNNVDINFILVEWVFSLFCSLIPLDIQITFFTNFFETKWAYFYRVCYCVLLSKHLDKIDDIDDIYLYLKLTKSNEDNTKEKRDYWEKILYDASIIEKF